MTPVKIAIAVCISVVVIVGCLLLYRYFFNNKKTEVTFLNKPRLIAENDAPFIDGRVNAKLSQIGVEYTYNMWVKVSDPGASDKPKCILYRSDTAPDAKRGQSAANPSIWLKSDNSLMVRASTKLESAHDYDSTLYPDNSTIEVKGSSSPGAYTIVNPVFTANAAAAKKMNSDQIAVCDVSSIPMQRWVQITVVQWNRTLDVYINGKLTRSCILPGVPLHDTDALKNIYIGGNDHFNGYISRFRYFNHAITAADVLKLYKKGPVPVTWWWNTMRNRVRVMLEIGEDDA